MPLLPFLVCMWGGGGGVNLCFLISFWFTEKDVLIILLFVVVVFGWAALYVYALE